MKYQIKDAPVENTETGNKRHLGVELEFSGISIDSSCNIVQKLFGGDIIKKTSFESEIKNTTLGSFTVEFDTSLLKNKRYKEILATVGIEVEGKTEENFEKLIESLLSPVIPYEIVAPPIEVKDLRAIDQLCETLSRAGAKGTQTSFLHAYGAHINIEIAREDCPYLLSVLRAFVLLLPELKKALKVDFTRNLSNFIKDFPKDYCKKILEPHYAPTLETFISDYLEYNPTRDRALDFTPIFGVINLEFVKSKMDAAYLLKPRPTFHYRLPNCEIGNPEWSIIREWNRWTHVEKLALELESIYSDHVNMDDFDEKIEFITEQYNESIHEE